MSAIIRVNPQGQGVHYRKRKRGKAGKAALLLIAAGIAGAAYMTVQRNTAPVYYTDAADAPATTAGAHDITENTPPVEKEAPARAKPAFPTLTLNSGAAVAEPPATEKETAQQLFDNDDHTDSAFDAMLADNQTDTASAGNTPQETPAAPPENAGPLMTNPRFHGTDAQSRPFNVLAQSAEWRDKNTAVLTDVKADTALENGFARLSAAKGVYSLEERVLELDGNVNLRATRPDTAARGKAGAYAELQARHIVAELREQRAYSDAPVTGISDIGTLEAGAFGYDAAGGVAVFTGGVTVTLDTELIAGLEE